MRKGKLMKTIATICVLVIAACAVANETGNAPDFGTASIVQGSTTTSSDYCTTTECDAYGNCWEVASDCGGAGGGGGAGTGGGAGGANCGSGGCGGHVSTCTSYLIGCDPALGTEADATCATLCGPGAMCFQSYPIGDQPAPPGYCY